MLHWKLLFSRFLRRFDIVLSNHESSAPTEEKIYKTQEKIISARARSVQWRNTHRTTELFRVYETERAVRKKQNNIGLSYIISACSGGKYKNCYADCSVRLHYSTLVDMLEKRFYGRSIQIIYRGNLRLSTR